jgi:molybdopterin-containing oxidoreductase family iron-sulfur binding subunit
MSAKSWTKLIPYVIPPEETVPGVWSYFASTCRECPAGCGMHLWHRDGRVTKAEGNPGHPVNRGGLCARGQSALQGLYDPDRLKEITHRVKDGPPENPMWAMTLEPIGNHIKPTTGKVALMSGLQTGALAEIMQSFVKAFGSDRIIFCEPFNYEALRAAHESVFGMAVIPDYRIEDCSMVVSLAADFLETWVSPVGYASQFASLRTLKEGALGRMVYAGPRLSMTAANADEYVQTPVGGEYWVAMAMLSAIIRKGWAKVPTEPIAPLIAAFDASTVPPALAGCVTAAQIEAWADEFVHAPASVALAGPTGGAGKMACQTAIAAALLNWVAGRVGQTVDFSRPHALSGTATRVQVQAFLEKITPEDTLIICDANPVYSIPGAAEHIRRAGTVVYMGTMPDETSELATWVLPVHSPLETWGDYAPMAGAHALMQPTMASLYDTQSIGDVLLGFSKVAEKPLLQEGYDTPATDTEQWLRRNWRALAKRIMPDQDPETFWHEALRAGGVWEHLPPVSVTLRPEVASLALAPFAPGPAEAATARLWAWPSVALFDGRTANRGWLQEAPDPTTFNVWGSWADMHPDRAAQLGLKDGQVLELKTDHGVIEAPVRITTDVSPDVVTLAFGQGHTALGRNAAHRGANVFMLVGQNPGDGPFPVVALRGMDRTAPAACADATQDQHGRSLLQWALLADVAGMKPGEGEDVRLPLPEGFDAKTDVYPPRVYKEHRWAMAVDLARCIGCGACAVACYAENNITVRGEKDVRAGREGAWLQVPPYRDPQDARRIGFIPLMCQHCDAAPCEPVCPVYASVHNEEGLNAQVYNRCIGTRYCSNNCPYKARRFNWFDREFVEPLNLQLNPEVTVRRRGVMEKCTFCIQRIRQGEHRARIEGRPVRDGEIQPACAQSCPTRAFTFGDLLDPNSAVSELTRRDPRRYHVLEDLNTKPGVTYLRRIKRSEA